MRHSAAVTPICASIIAAVDDKLEEKAVEPAELERRQRTIAAARADAPRRVNEGRLARHGLMLYNRYDMYVGRSLALYGEFSEYEVELFENFVRPGGLIVDVGANIGTHTLFMAHAVGVTGTVIAFEPQRLVFQALCANLALNDIVNVMAYQCAVGCVAGSIKVPVLKPDEIQNFGGLMLGGAQEGESVPVVTLDSLGLMKCSLIKADVEGMEQDVLRGAEQTIRRHRPLLYVENDRAEKSAALIELIQRFGYRLWWHLPPLYHPANIAGNTDNVFPGIVSVNLLCVPREIPCNIKDLREVRGPEDTWRQ